MLTPGEHRKLVFWYDESASFEDEVEQLNIPRCDDLPHETKHTVRHQMDAGTEHPDESFLIYAPYAKPALEDNHLADMLFYSQEYSTDR